MNSTSTSVWNGIGQKQPREHSSMNTSKYYEDTLIKVLWTISLSIHTKGNSHQHSSLESRHLCPIWRIWRRRRWVFHLLSRMIPSKLPTCTFYERYLTSRTQKKNCSAFFLHSFIKDIWGTARENWQRLFKKKLSWILLLLKYSRILIKAADWCTRTCSMILHL